MAISIAISAYPREVFGGGDGGGRDRVNNSDANTSINNNKSQKLDVKYTQDYLPKVRRVDLETAIRANKQGHKVVIEGFNKKTSSMIFEMLLLDRIHTITLLRDMRRYKTKKNRVGALQAEILRNEERIEEFNDREAWEREDEAIRYGRLLRLWAQRPMQGLLK